jgi:hypothetical protein
MRGHYNRNSPSRSSRDLRCSKHDRTERTARQSRFASFSESSREWVQQPMRSVTRASGFRQGTLELSGLRTVWLRGLLRYLWLPSGEHYRDKPKLLQCGRNQAWTLHQVEQWKDISSKIVIESMLWNTLHSTFQTQVSTRRPRTWLSSTIRATSHP